MFSWKLGGQRVRTNGNDHLQIFSLNQMTKTERYLSQNKPPNCDFTAILSVHSRPFCSTVTQQRIQ